MFFAYFALGYIVYLALGALLFMPIFTFVDDRRKERKRIQTEELRRHRMEEVYKRHAEEWQQALEAEARRKAENPDIRPSYRRDEDFYRFSVDDVLW